MSTLRSSASFGALAFAIGATPVLAQSADEERQGGVGVIIVTATKQSEDLQDVPISVNAIGEEQLDELGIDTFDDYLEQLPSVTAGGSGPGQNTVYIRGLASTTPNITTAGVSGLAPNVAMYLDEQPLAQPGRNLDVYAADMERIEVLSGPQGTLFGASSQAGVVRLISNKPSLSGFDAAFNAGASFTRKGEWSYKFDGMVNVPVSDSFALRGVVYFDDQGGYIDNVAGQRSVAESARFRPVGTVRANGVVVAPNRAGFQAGSDLSNVNFIAADNAALVEKDINDSRYLGMRISGRYEFSPDWSLTVSHARQSLDSDGVFFADPELDLSDPAIQRFDEDRLEDDFNNTAWTLEGRLAMLDIVYTGAYTDRTSSQRVDYTDYLFVGQYLPYYICDGSVTYPGNAAPSGTCQAPNLYVTSESQAKVQTHELRFNTPQENRFRVTAGGFYSDLELTELNDFAYPGNVAAAPFGAFAPNFPFPGYSSDPGPFPAETIFRNDVRRTDKQFGLFGEASFDIIEDQLSLTLGARYYNIKVDLEGSANGSFCNSGAAEDQNAFGTNINDLYDGDGRFTFIGSCNPALRQTFTQGQSVADIMAAGLSEAQAIQVFNALSAPDKSKAKGTIFKGTLTYTPNSDLLFYATYSEGFRPGLLNRPGGAPGPNGYQVPFELETDEVKNYELGWKMDLMDGQMRFNGSAFFVDISRLQTTIFDPSIVNLFFSDNAADAEIRGLEGEFTVAPYSAPGLTVAGAFSFLDTKVTEVLTPTTDVLPNSPLAFAPKFQGNIRVRYEWDQGDLTYHVMPQLVHSSSKYTDVVEINKLKLDGYTTLGFAAGLAKDQWSLELYIDNLTDTRAQVGGNFVFDRERININRPRTVGFRVGYKY